MGVTKSRAEASLCGNKFHLITDRDRDCVNTPKAQAENVRTKIMLLLYLFAGTLRSTLDPEPGRYDTLGLLARDCTIALLASIFLRAKKASPALSSALEIVAAASASPSARMTEA